MVDGIFGNSLQDVDENDIIAGIGYFMSKNYNEESKFEDVIEHLDGVLDKIWLVVVKNINNDFIPKNMASIFIESSMNHKALQCLKHINSHGVLNGVNPTWCFQGKEKVEERI